MAGWRAVHVYPNAQEMLFVVTDLTDELACEFVTSDTGHSWEVEICLDTDDLPLHPLLW